MTAVSGTTLNAEANLEFDGSTLTVGGGGAFTGNIDLNSDTNKLKLGAGDDFQFWHNGSSNYIWTNSGPINIQSTESSGNNGYISFTSGGTTERLRINSDGRLKINHNQTPGQLDDTWLSIYDANSDSSANDPAGISKNYAMIALHNYGTGSPGDVAGIAFGAASSFAYTKSSIAHERTGSYGTGD